MRNWPIPPAEHTLHLVGDTQQVSPARRAIVLNDLARTDQVPDVAHRLQVGDFTGNGLAPQFTETIGFMDAMGSGQWWATVGNHDLDGISTNPDVAAQAMGMPSANYSVDLGYIVLVSFYVRAGTMNVGGTGPADESAPDVAWLNTELNKYAGRTVAVFAHPNLQGTTLFRDGAAGEMATEDDNLIRPVIASHPCVKAWLCGHSHLPINYRGMVSTLSIGGRDVTAIDAGAMLYTGPSVEWTDELWSPYLTVYDDEFEVRFRNHGSHQWVGGSQENRRKFVLAVS